MENELSVMVVGRPNVGKSHLFNALLGYRRAIVFDRPGTTRDEVGELTDWGKGPIRLFDTEGVVDIPQSELPRQAVYIFVVDAKHGISPYDRPIADWLRINNANVILCVNKVDCTGGQIPPEFYKLGFSKAIATSAAHRKGLDAIKNWCLKHQTESDAQKHEIDVNVALVGRPNTGKSTLMNTLCRQEVSRVSPIAHTTRDPISFELTTKLGSFRFVDTAGIRRRGVRHGDPIEVFSVHAAKRSIRQSQLVFLLLDASTDFYEQDQRLIDLVDQEAKPAIVLLNFWDRMDETQRHAVLSVIRSHPILKKYPCHPISALTGWNTERCFSMASKLWKSTCGRVPTSTLNRLVKHLVQKNPPPSAGTGNFNVLYASQVSVAPPTFVFFLNRKHSLPKSYESYLQNSLRKELGLRGQSIRLHFRAKPPRKEQSRTRKSLV